MSPALPLGLALSLAACAAPAAAPAKDPPMTSSPSTPTPTPTPNGTKCLAELTTERGLSPWQGYTGSAAEEAAGKSVSAVADLAGLERVPHLAKYDLAGKPLLAIDREKHRVVVSAEHFGDLQRAEVTRSGVTLVGTVKSAALRAAPRQLALFLVESQLVQTFVHLEAKLCLASEEDGEKAYVARFTGSHLYFTNRRNEKPLDFRILLDKATGALRVESP